MREFVFKKVFYETQLARQLRHRHCPCRKHPDVDVQYIRFTDLHRYVCELDNFVGEPDKSNEAILEAIQMAWLDELDW